MRVNYNYIKIFGLLALVVFLCAFSSERNAKRKLPTPEIKFIGDDNLFVTHETVSKLLIVNEGTVTNKPKEIIDLNELETALKSNQMIKNAQVFMSVNGLITAEIEQRKPIARVRTSASYYIDDEGHFMPLSHNYTARVPLVTGAVDKNNLQNIYQVAKKVQEDDFLLVHVVEIHQNNDKTIDLKFRNQEFTIHLGNLELLDKKINNLKAFYVKAKKDNLLDDYQLVNLKFDQQVICSKK
ncbi:cell division protein FtsQ/DivIB [Sediminibacter sp. Hel_I_10]|uniref:cell division protein FtsQ/DivIB n=1 Tax=Sediminibacter sp. Hel_I_10 TaxID=1392490 RepID=UPI00047E81BC|nr:cell division protein FtsQ/DivIB [Sediminibacter sp. Hel_I_10]